MKMNDKIKENTTKRLSGATAADYEELLKELQGIGGCSCAQESAQRFVDRIYEWFCRSLVLLRLFITMRYDELPEEDRRKDSQERMIVPKQEFVTANGLKTTLGFGSGYASHPTLVTLFAFTNETVERSAVKPITNLLEAFTSSTESLVGKGRFFEG